MSELKRNTIMRVKLIFGLCALLFIVLYALSIILKAQPINAQPIKITVTPSETSKMPDIFKPGIFTLRAEPPNYAMQQWLGEMRPGIVEIDLGEHVFQRSENASDVIARTQKLMPLLKRIQAAGGKPVLAISRIPIWLSSQPTAQETTPGETIPKAAIVPPRSNEAWSDLISQFTLTLKTELGNVPAIKIGWEPDQAAWQSSETDYFNFYRDTVRGIKKIDLTAPVGGPAVSALFNRKGNHHAEPMLLRFLEYCARTPLSELGLKKLPLDFIIWHQFGTEPILSWQIATTQVRAWLTQTGYPQNTRLIIGEWSISENDTSEKDLPSLAAYIVASLVSMDQAGISQAAFTSLLEQRDLDNQIFIGSFGVFTNQFIKKPAYWAFHAISKLGDTRLQTHSNHPLISVLAGKPNASEIGIVIATHIPNEAALQRSFIAKLLAAGMKPNDIIQITKNRSLNQLLTTNAPDDVNTEAKQKLTQAQQALLPLVHAIKNPPSDKQEIHLEIKNFDLSNTNIELWRIDSTHTNPIQHLDRISQHTNQRLQQEKQDLPKKLLQHLQEKGYQKEQLEWFETVMRSPNKENALALHPIDQRIIIQSMANAAQQFIDERLSTIGQEINAWPENTFKTSETLNAKENIITFTLPSNAVAYLRIIQKPAQHNQKTQENIK